MLLGTIAYAVVPLTSFETVIGVQRDGSAVIVEKFVPAVPLSNVEWSTSTEYPGEWTIHQPRVVSILQVTTTDGRPLRYSVRHGLTRLHLNIETGGAREFRIVY